MRSTRIRVMNPGGGSAIGGKVTPGPTYVWASRCRSSGAPPSCLPVDNCVVAHPDRVRAGRLQ